MSDSEIWANAVLCGNILLNGHVHSTHYHDAAHAVAELTRNVVLCGAPTELFSDKMPAFIPQGPTEDGLFPIDVLYGRYSAETKTIEVYIENIRRDYALFGDFDAFLYLVRVHEHAHAVVHLGISENDLMEALKNLGSDGVTNWSAFAESRTRTFLQIDSPSHEFLAQAITYAVAKQHPASKHWQERLTDTFLKLEKRQPEKYVIPEEVKKAIASTNWPMLLSAARGNPEIPVGPDFELVSGLQELALKRCT